MWANEAANSVMASRVPYSADDAVDVRLLCSRSKHGMLCGSVNEILKKKKKLKKQHKILKNS